MMHLLRDVNRLWSLLDSSDRWKFALLFVLMSLGGSLEAISIGAVPAFVSVIMKPSSLSAYRWASEWLPALPDVPTLNIVLVASTVFLALIMLKNGFLVFVYSVQARIVANQRIKLGNRMFRTYQAAPYEWHLLRSSPQLIRNIQIDTTQVLNSVLVPFLGLSMSIIMMLFIIIMLLVTAPSVALSGLVVTGAGLYLVIKLLHKQMRRLGETIRKETKEVVKAIQQGFGALVDARIIGCESALHQAFSRALQRGTRAMQREFIINRSTPLAMETFAIAGLLATLLLLMRGSRSLDAMLPAIFLLGAATLRLKQLLSQIATTLNQINAGRAYIPSITRDLHELEAIGERQRAADAVSIGKFRSLLLDNVTYTYPEAARPAVKNISLEIVAGESVAFVGTSGCGKSTLVSLILGLLQPDSGQVSVNGGNIHNSISSWRAHLGYIPQSIYLVDDSITANIAFGVPRSEVDPQRLKFALQSARLEDFIASLPHGVDTVVGERGMRLSGGQRQRIGIARALYHNPDVLVMDEATAAVDNKTEVEVMAAVNSLKRDRTFIIIAHRLSTVVNCDRLYFLRHGEIVDVGSYERLLSTSAAFREMSLQKSARP
jgi:ABC-type multidrug transport system fused ATPase/permease subunit